MPNPPMPAEDAPRATSGGAVRPMRREDLPAIGRLFEAVFRRREQAAPEALIRHLADIYLDHPWHDEATPSLIFESEDGAVDGFVGVLPLRLRFGERRLSGAVAGSLMVRDAARRPMAGARLLRVFLNGKQDISFGDTTNATSEGLWRRLGGSALPLASMEWLKIVRPARFAAGVAANRMAWAGFALNPLGSAIDAIVRLVRRRRPFDPAWDAQTVDDEGFIAALTALSRTDEFALDLEPDIARWFLRQAALKQRHGPLHRRIVRDRGGRIIGAYLIYGRRGQPAEMLQTLTDARHGDAVLASMGRFADEIGCSAVRGRTQPVLMQALFRAGCLMRHRSFTVVDTRDAALMQAIERGASLGGFFGETWTRIVSDTFDGLTAADSTVPHAALRPQTAA